MRATRKVAHDWAGVQAHTGLIWKLARRFAAQRDLRYLDIEDLFQVGLESAARAIPRFDPSKGAISTWVGVYAWGAMANELKDTTYLRLPRMQWDAKGEAFLRSVRRPLSIDPDRPLPIAEPVPSEPSEIVEDLESLATLHQAILDLPGRLRVIVRGRYFEGRTLGDLGAELGVSREWVRQLERRAIDELTKHLARRRTAVPA